MKTKVMSFSGTEDYDALINVRAQAEGLTRSAHMRKCIREEAERAAANSAGRFRGMDLKALISAFAS